MSHAQRRAARRGGPVYWTATPELQGRAAFIICGGPSVQQQDLSLLKGHPVCVINSSVYTYPEADFLYFGDFKWWVEHRRRLKDTFKGRIVSVDGSIPPEDPVLRMHKSRPPGLATSPDTVMQKATSLTAAINLFDHLGPDPIVLLGADGREIVRDGKTVTHHHVEMPHKWKLQANRFERWRADLETIVEPLQLRGKTILNVSPGTQWPWWPVYERIEDVLPLIDRKQAA